MHCKYCWIGLGLSNWQWGLVSYLSRLSTELVHDLIGQFLLLWLVIHVVSVVGRWHRTCLSTQHYTRGHVGRGHAAATSCGPEAVLRLNWVLALGFLMCLRSVAQIEWFLPISETCALGTQWDIVTKKTNSISIQEILDQSTIIPEVNALLIMILIWARCKSYTY